MSAFTIYRQEGNVIEAGANGAAAAGKTVVAVVVNLIAFVSVLTFVNATLRWFGARVGYDNPPWSFQVRTIDKGTHAITNTSIQYTYCDPIMNHTRCISPTYISVLNDGK